MLKLSRLQSSLLTKEIFYSRNNDLFNATEYKMFFFVYRCLIVILETHSTRQDGGTVSLKYQALSG